MSHIKRHLEDISEAIGFQGEINRRVICTASLVDEMSQSYVINSDTPVTPISELVLNLKYYCRHKRLDELKRDLIKLVSLTRLKNYLNIISNVLTITLNRRQPAWPGFIFGIIGIAH